MTREAVEAEIGKVVAWLRKDVGSELIKMRLMAGIPGGTAHQRAKSRSHLDGADWLHGVIVSAIERGEYK